jgi:hypothetical protein
VPAVFGHYPRSVVAHSRRRIALAGIAFLIAMIGVASCTLGGLYLLFRDDYPSDEAKKRRKRVLVSNWKQLLFVIRTQNLACLRVHQMRLGARKARHLNVSEVIVLGVISGPSLYFGAAVE